MRARHFLAVVLVLVLVAIPVLAGNAGPGWLPFARGSSAGGSSAGGAASMMEDGTTCAADVGLAFSGDPDTGLYLVDVGTAPGHAIGMCVDGTAAGLVSIASAADTCSYHNTLLGWSAGASLDLTGGCAGEDATRNTAIGASAGRDLTTGSRNVYVGERAGVENETWVANTCLGHQACEMNNAGPANTCIGERACKEGVDTYATAVGYRALMNHNVVGTSYNTAIGAHVMAGAALGTTTGERNTGVGFGILRDYTTGHRNTAVGYNALSAGTTALRNVAVGNSSGTAVTTGRYHTLVGDETGVALTSQDGDTFLGAQAGQLSTATQSTYVGWYAARDATSADNNTVIGAVSALGLTTGDRNVLVGALANVNAGTRADCIGIGYGVTCAADASIYLGTATQTQLVTSSAWRGPAGSAAAPAVSSSGDSNSGLRFAAGLIGVVIDAVDILLIDGTNFGISAHTAPGADETYDLGLNGFSWDQLRVRQVTRGNPGGGDELELADTVIMRQQTTSSAPDSLRLPAHLNADVSTNRPPCSTSADAGRLVYLDDTDDAVVAGVCVCGANAANAYGWRSISNFGVNCHL